MTQIAKSSIINDEIKVIEDKIIIFDISGNINEIQFINCHFNSTNKLSNEVFNDCSFINCIFTNLKIHDVEYRNCTFINSNISNTEIYDCFINDETTFVNCNFQNSKCYNILGLNNNNKFLDSSGEELIFIKNDNSFFSILVGLNLNCKDTNYNNYEFNINDVILSNKLSNFDFTNSINMNNIKDHYGLQYKNIIHYNNQIEIKIKMNNKNDIYQNDYDIYQNNYENEVLIDNMNTKLNDTPIDFILNYIYQISNENQWYLHSNNESYSNNITESNNDTYFNNILKLDLFVLRRQIKNVLMELYNNKNNYNIVDFDNIVDGVSLFNLNFTDLNIDNIHFKNNHFYNYNIYNNIHNNINYTNCTITNKYILKFNDIGINYGESIQNISVLTNDEAVNDLTTQYYIKLKNTYKYNVRLNTFINNTFNTVLFENIKISDCCYNDCELSNNTFENCELHLLNYYNCNLNNNKYNQCLNNQLSYYHSNLLNNLCNNNDYNNITYNNCQLLNTYNNCNLNKIVYNNCSVNNTMVDSSCNHVVYLLDLSNVINPVLDISSGIYNNIVIVYYPNINLTNVTLKRLKFINQTDDISLNISNTLIKDSILIQNTLTNNIINSELNNIIFKNVDFKNMVLNKSTIINNKFINCSFKNVHLLDSSFNNTLFENCYFDSSCVFDSIVFNNTNMKYCNLDNVNVYNVKFSKRNSDNGFINSYDNCIIKLNLLNKDSIDYNNDTYDSYYFKYTQMSSKPILELYLDNKILNEYNHLFNKIDNNYKLENTNIIGFIHYLDYNSINDIILLNNTTIYNSELIDNVHLYDNTIFLKDRIMEQDLVISNSKLNFIYEMNNTETRNLTLKNNIFYNKLQFITLNNNHLNIESNHNIYGENISTMNMSIEYDLKYNMNEPFLNIHSDKFIFNNDTIKNMKLVNCNVNTLEYNNCIINILYLKNGNINNILFKNCKIDTIFIGGFYSIEEINILNFKLMNCNVNNIYYGDKISKISILKNINLYDSSIKKLLFRYTQDYTYLTNIDNINENTSYNSNKPLVTTSNETNWNQRLVDVENYNGDYIIIPKNKSRENKHSNHFEKIFIQNVNLYNCDIKYISFDTLDLENFNTYNTTLKYVDFIRVSFFIDKLFNVKGGSLQLNITNSRLYHNDFENVELNDSTILECDIYENNFKDILWNNVRFNNSYMDWNEDFITNNIPNDLPVFHNDKKINIFTDIYNVSKTLFTNKHNDNNYYNDKTITAIHFNSEIQNIFTNKLNKNITFIDCTFELLTGTGNEDFITNYKEILSNKNEINKKHNFVKFLNCSFINCKIINPNIFFIDCVIDNTHINNVYTTDNNNNSITNIDNFKKLVNNNIIINVEDDYITLVDHSYTMNDTYLYLPLVSDTIQRNVVKSTFILDLKELFINNNVDFIDSHLASINNELQMKISFDLEIYNYDELYNYTSVNYVKNNQINYEFTLKKENNKYNITYNTKYNTNTNTNTTINENVDGELFLNIETDLDTQIYYNNAGININFYYKLNNNITPCLFLYNTKINNTSILLKDTNENNIILYSDPYSLKYNNQKNVKTMKNHYHIHNESVYEYFDVITLIGKGYSMENSYFSQNTIETWENTPTNGDYEVIDPNMIFTKGQYTYLTWHKLDFHNQKIYMNINFYDLIIENLEIKDILFLNCNFSNVTFNNCNLIQFGFLFCSGLNNIKFNKSKLSIMNIT